MFTPLLPTWLFCRPCRTCDKRVVPPVGPRDSPPHWAPLAVVWRLGLCQPFLREQSQQTLRCLCALGLVCVTVITSVSTIRRDTRLASPSLLTLSRGRAQTRLSVTPAVLSPQHERRLSVCRHFRLHSHEHRRALHGLRRGVGPHRALRRHLRVLVEPQGTGTRAPCLLLPQGLCTHTRAVALWVAECLAVKGPQPSSTEPPPAWSLPPLCLPRVLMVPPLNSMNSP